MLPGIIALAADRCGSAIYSTARLKAIQEVVILVVDGVSAVQLKGAISWITILGLALAAAGAVFIFRDPWPVARIGVGTTGGG
jgi:uncharacterized protein (DUF486 family)